jgi:hypothetical protein
VDGGFNLGYLSAPFLLVGALLPWGTYRGTEDLVSVPNEVAVGGAAIALLFLWLCGRSGALLSAAGVAVCGFGSLAVVIYSFAEIDSKNGTVLGKPATNTMFEPGLFLSLAAAAALVVAGLMLIRATR